MGCPGGQGRGWRRCRGRTGGGGVGRGEAGAVRGCGVGVSGVASGAVVPVRSRHCGGVTPYQAGSGPGRRSGRHPEFHRRCRGRTQAAAGLAPGPRGAQCRRSRQVPPGARHRDSPRVPRASGTGPGLPPATPSTRGSARSTRTGCPEQGRDDAAKRHEDGRSGTGDSPRPAAVQAPLKCPWRPEQRRDSRPAPRPTGRAVRPAEPPRTRSRQRDGSGSWRYGAARRVPGTNPAPPW